MVGKTLGHFEILEPLGKGGSFEANSSQMKSLPKEAHNAAFTAGDVDGFIDLFSDDAQALRNGNSVLVGKEAIRSWEEEVFDQFHSEMTYFSDEIGLMGEVAFNLGTYRLTQTPKAGGDSISFYGNYILVLRKQADGSWKITRYMWNNRPDPEM